MQTQKAAGLVNRGPTIFVCIRNNILWDKSGNLDDYTVTPVIDHGCEGNRVDLKTEFILPSLTSFPLQLRRVLKKEKILTSENRKEV